jgi:pimeloyl-ACP methyl ester carboxylesterase
MSSFGGTMTRRQALGLAGSGGLALFAALSGLPETLGVLGPDTAVDDSPPNTKALTASFQSQALRSRLHFAVYLPASYARGSDRYPVVYFLHGLPASPTSYLQLEWVSEALAQTGRDAILVVPQGTRVAGGDPEYHDWGPGDDWETALARELPARMDANYRTLADRRGRAIVGYSAGGYGASIIGLHHPDKFPAAPATSAYLLVLLATTAVLGSSSATTDNQLLLSVSTNLHQFAHDPVRVLIASAFGYVVATSALFHTFTNFGHLAAVAIGLACYPLVRTQTGRSTASKPKEEATTLSLQTKSRLSTGVPSRRKRFPVRPYPTPDMEHVWSQARATGGNR